jgi:hypothetical protein
MIRRRVPPQRSQNWWHRLWDSLRSWLRRLFGGLTSKPTHKTQHIRPQLASRQSPQTEDTEEVGDDTKSSLLGFHEHEKLGTLSSADLFRSLNWDIPDFEDLEDLSFNVESFDSDVANPSGFVTETLLKEIQWDIESPITSVLSQNSLIREAFLLGLEDLSDLDSFSTINFLDLIKWETESPVAREEDLTFLEDLLAEFPE